MIPRLYPCVIYPRKTSKEKLILALELAGGEDNSDVLLRVLSVRCSADDAWQISGRRFCRHRDETTNPKSASARRQQRARPVLPRIRGERETAKKRKRFVYEYHRYRGGRACQAVCVSTRRGNADEGWDVHDDGPGVMSRSTGGPKMKRAMEGMQRSEEGGGLVHEDLACRPKEDSISGTLVKAIDPGRYFEVSCDFKWAIQYTGVRVEMRDEVSSESEADCMYLV
ncbi:hypothetical protein R3P38DRAFT_3048244 [Favolaschia claudopus]|uniref:Uncharacterized protein n=1 Tax=Favolaschia claudopus TaxID=2862362 RepID=A0AAW0A550_9AGAR